jgi:predicted amidohydrolase YtcJ
VRHFLALVLVLGLGVPLFAAGPKADRVFVNGRVWTGEEKQPRGEALAVRNDTILAVGKTDVVRKVVPPLAPGEKERALKKGIERLVAQGLTGVHAVNLDPEDLPLLERLDAEHALKVRVYAFFEPYGGGNAGDLAWTPEELFRSVAAYDKEKFQVCRHAIGDRAIDLALRAFEKVGGGAERRHRVEHIEVPRLVGGQDTYRAREF